MWFAKKNNVTTTHFISDVNVVQKHPHMNFQKENILKMKFPKKTF